MYHKYILDHETSFLYFQPHEIYAHIHALGACAATESIYRWCHVVTLMNDSLHSNDRCSTRTLSYPHTTTPLKA